MSPSSLLQSWRHRPDGNRASRIAPTLAAAAREEDESGRLSAATLASLRESGLLAMALPQIYGGLELSPIDAVAEIGALAAGNAAAAWYAAVSSTGSTAAWFLAEPAVKCIWANGAATLVGGSGQAGGAAEPVDGGIRLPSGRWPWGSGVRDADWMQVGLTLSTGGAATAFLPRDGGFVPEDDWNAIGLRASSSGSFRAVADQAIADMFVLRKAPGEARKPVIDTALSRFSVVSYNSALFAAVAVGNALGALDEFASLAERKTAVTASASLARSPDTWRQFGKALVTVAGARSLLHDAVSGLMAEAETGASCAPQRQALARTSFAAAADQSTRAVQLCFELAGSSAVEKSCPLERRLRDALVINQHYYLSKRAPSLLGKIHFENDLTDFEHDYLRR